MYRNPPRDVFWRSRRRQKRVLPFPGVVLAWHCEFISGCWPWPFRSSIQFSFCVSLLPQPALMGSLRDESASLVILLPRRFRKCSLLLSSCWGTGTYWRHSHVRETDPGPQDLSPKPGFE